MDQTEQNAAIAATKVADAATTAAKIVANAADEASNVAMKAALTAADAAKHNEREMIKVLSEALRQVFGENQASQKFIDVSRIPLICANIDGIHETQKAMDKKLDGLVNQDQFGPVKTIVYGLVTLILTSVVVALLTLVLRK